MYQHLGDYIPKIHPVFISFPLQYEPLAQTDCAFHYLILRRGIVMIFTLMFHTMEVDCFFIRQIGCMKNEWDFKRSGICWFIYLFELSV